MPEPATTREETPADVQAVSSQVVRSFLCKLLAPKGEDNVETVPYRLTVTAPRGRKRRPAWITPVPYHPEDDAPTQGTCFLQIWELDLFRANKWKTNEETDVVNEERNQLLGVIPGIVVRSGSGKKVRFEFRALGSVAPTRTRDELNGTVTLELKDGEGEYQQHEVHLPEYESVLELAAVLVPRDNDPRLDTVVSCSALTFVHNVQASARRQIKERGGISIALVSDYAIENARTDSTQRNNAEMSRQAKSMIATLPTFVVKKGKLRFGYHLIKGWKSAPTKVSEVTSTVKAELGLGEAPKVTTLTLYAHGVRRRLQLDPASYRRAGSLQDTSCKDFVSAFKAHLGKGLVVSLFACNNGRGHRAGGEHSPSDSTYGRSLVGEIPGHGSLGWALFRELEAQEIGDVTVWAHTTSGHTTRNSRLRVFSSWGVADFTSLLFGGRNLATKTYRHYASRFGYNFKTQKRSVALTRLSNSNRVRSISVQSARYFSWAWQYGKDPDEKAEGFVAVTKRLVDTLLEGLLSLMVITDLEPEDWAYADDKTKLHILGRSEDGDEKAKLSAHFSYREFKRSVRGRPLRLSVKLTQALDILRCETRVAIKVEALIEGGDGARLKVNKRKRQALLDKANEFVSEGLLTGAWEADERVVISVSGLRYDAPMDWVNGCAPTHEDTARVARSIPWGSVAHVGKVRRSLVEAVQYLVDKKQAKVGGVNEDGTAFKLAADDLAGLEAAARELLGSGKDGVSLGRVKPIENALVVGADAEPPAE